MNLFHNKDIISEMNRYYDDRAPWHDSLMSYTDQNSMKEQLSDLISYIEPTIYGKNILEVACGTGNWSCVLAQYANSVTATDISAKSIELAQEKFNSQQNLSFQLVDAYKLNTMKRTFDTIFMADFYSHIPNEMVDCFYNNLLQISDSNTVVVSLDMTEKEVFKNEEFYFDSYKNRVSQRKLPNGSSYEIIKNFPSEADLKNSILSIGSNFTYIIFPNLERWLMTFALKLN